MDIIIKYIPPDKWHQNTNWMLLYDYISPEGILIPAGFISDGASVPLLVKWIISPTGKIFPAALVHDYLLHVGCDWDMANKAFHKELQHVGISKLRTFVIMSSVRVYGKCKDFTNKLRGFHGNQNS